MVSLTAMMVTLEMLSKNCPVKGYIFPSDESFLKQKWRKFHRQRSAVLSTYDTVLKLQDQDFDTFQLGQILTSQIGQSYFYHSYIVFVLHIGFLGLQYAFCDFHNSVFQPCELVLDHLPSHFFSRHFLFDWVEHQQNCFGAHFDKRDSAEYNGKILY